jgi:putrescine transport system permease protein
MSARNGAGTLTALGLGYAFLYLPILLIVLFSFNAAPAPNAWGGFSLRWYRELAGNERMLDAAMLSLGIAALAATLAAVLGACAGLALARHGRFALRALFAALLATPLIMPEVITGIANLLLFVSLELQIGWPSERGFATIVIAHATFGMAYVAVVVQARLATLDRSLEEAAADLGARPARVFFAIILPLLWPAIAAGWLLAFTLSLDDVVIASFVSGPGATTLPVFVFGTVRRGLSPQVNALASLLVAAVVLTALAIWLFARRHHDHPVP